MSDEIRAHQIEELLLNAHLENEGGIDLIEEYFMLNSSLDRVTEHAQKLLKKNSDSMTREAVLKNLSESIVVKIERDKHSLWGVARRLIGKMGIPLNKSSEIIRAERLLKSYRQPKT